MKVIGYLIFSSEKNIDIEHVLLKLGRFVDDRIHEFEFKKLGIQDVSTQKNTSKNH